MMTFIQTVIVVVILAVMVMLLISINHLFLGSFDTDQKDVKALREDVDKNADVISDKSIFHELLTGKNNRQLHGHIQSEKH